MQITLFETAEQKRQEIQLKKIQEQRENETFEELELRIARQHGRRHIGFPCDIAQDMSIDERGNHIKNCSECKKLLEKLEKKLEFR